VAQGAFRRPSVWWNGYLGIQGMAECKVSLLSPGVKIWWSQLHRKELSGHCRPGGTGDICPGAFNLHQKSTSYMPEACYPSILRTIEEEK